MTTKCPQPVGWACRRKAEARYEVRAHSLTLLDWNWGQEIDPTVIWSGVTVSSQPCKGELNSNLKATESLPGILTSAQPSASPVYLASPLFQVSAMANPRSSNVKEVLILKGEDTARLRWAHMANRGEEKKAHWHMQVLHKAVKRRCRDIDKEMAVLGKFLEKVKTSTGHLTRICQHKWSDGSLPEEESQKESCWLPLPRATVFLLDGVKFGIHEHLLPLCTSLSVTLWRTPVAELYVTSNPRPLRTMLENRMKLVFWR